MEKITAYFFLFFLRKTYKKGLNQRPDSEVGVQPMINVKNQGKKRKCARSKLIKYWARERRDAIICSH